MDLLNNIENSSLAFYRIFIKCQICFRDVRMLHKDHSLLFVKMYKGVKSKKKNLQLRLS